MKHIHLCFFLILITLNATSIRKESNLNLPTNPKKTVLYAAAYQKYFFWLPNIAFVADSNESPNGQILSKIVDEIITSSQNQASLSSNLTERLSTYIKNRFRGITTKEVEQEIDTFAQTLALQNNDLEQNHENYYKHLHRKLKQLGLKETKASKIATVYWYNGRFLAVLKKHLKTKSDLKMLKLLARKNYSSIHGNIMIDSVHSAEFSLWKEGSNGLKMTFSSMNYDSLEQDNKVFLNLAKVLKYTFAPLVTFLELVIPNEPWDNISTHSATAPILMDIVRGRPPTPIERKQIHDLSQFKKMDLELFIERKITLLNGKNKKIGHRIKTFQNQCTLKRDKLKFLFRKVEYYQNYIFNEAWNLREILRKENKGLLLDEKEKKDKVKYTEKIKKAYKTFQIIELEHELSQHIKKKLKQRGLDNLFTDKTIQIFAKDFISIDGISFPSYIYMSALRPLMGLKFFKNFNDYNMTPLYEIYNSTKGLKTFFLNFTDHGEITSNQKKPFQALGKVIRENRSIDTFNLVTTIRERAIDGGNHVYSLKIEKKNHKYSLYYFCADIKIKTNGKLDRLKETIKNSDGRGEKLIIQDENEHEDRLNYQTSFYNCCGVASASTMNFLESNSPIDQKGNVQAEGLRLILEGLLETDTSVMKEYMTRSRRRFYKFYKLLTSGKNRKKILQIIQRSILFSENQDASLKAFLQGHAEKYKGFFSDKPILNGDDPDTAILKNLKKLIHHNHPDLKMDKSSNFVYISDILEQ